MYTIFDEETNTRVQRVERLEDFRLFLRCSEYQACTLYDGWIINKDGERLGTAFDEWKLRKFREELDKLNDV